jgi:hypothetical protein
VHNAHLRLIVIVKINIDRIDREIDSRHLPVQSPPSPY